jgi:3-oxoacyl-[acyl-carrier protein] reductase
VDAVAAFAGGLGNPIPTWDDTPEHWRAVLDVNLTATFLTVKCFLPGMRERRRGAIVTMASSAARLPSPASAAYAAAKAGIMMFTRHFANELGGQGVRVNCIAPAAVRTERMEAAMTAEQLPRLAARPFACELVAPVVRPSPSGAGFETSHGPADEAPAGRW